MTFLIVHLKRWFLILLLVPGSGIDAGWPAVAQPQSSPEYQVKAAFLYNFAKFVEWPAGSFPGAQTPLIIGVLGRDPFGEALDTLRDKIVDGRKLVIKRFVKAEDLEKCHILFISGEEKENLSRVLKKVGGWPVLTVGDTKGLAQSGVIINFILVENKVRFEINVNAAGRAGLKISSQLLKLATIYRENS